jgi:hypothetical protein
MQYLTYLKQFAKNFTTSFPKIINFPQKPSIPIIIQLIPINVNNTKNINNFNYVKK